MYKSNKYKEQDVVPNTFRIQQLIDKDWFTLLYNNGPIPLQILVEDVECWTFQSPRFKFRIIDYNTGKVVYE